MERACRKCKGERGRYVNRRNNGFFGLGASNRDWIRCDVCGGSGVNPKYRETSCERCYRTIGYSVDSKFPPKYCQNCKPIVAREKDQARQNRQQHSSAPPHRTQQHRSQDDKWREKSCPGLKGESGCGWRATIRYRTDWNRIPDLCPNCVAKIKQQKADRDAKMREKPCAARNCHNIVKYNIDWEHPPNFCKSCSDKRKALQAQYPNISKPYETTNTSYVMPGMGQTIGQMGGTRGKHYPRQGVIHCMVFEGMRGDDLHYSWDLDPLSGEVIGQVYMHQNNPRG